MMVGGAAAVGFGFFFLRVVSLLHLVLFYEAVDAVFDWSSFGGFEIDAFVVFLVIQVLQKGRVE